MSGAANGNAGSGTSSSTPGSFAEADKVDIRRYCWYPAYGAGAAGFQGWRFFQAYGLLEYRLNSLSVAEVAVVQTTYLGNLRPLEAAMVAAAANLATDAAGSWKHNRAEVADRARLLDAWRLRLCGFIGVPPGPGRVGSGPEIVI